MLIEAQKGDEWSRTLFTPEVEQQVTFVVNNVVLQELLFHTAAAGQNRTIDPVTQALEVIDSEAYNDPELLGFLQRLRLDLAARILSGHSLTQRTETAICFWPWGWR